MVTNIKYLTRCLCFDSLIKETNSVVRFIVLKTVMSFMSCTFASGIHILNVSNTDTCLINYINLL